MLWYVFMGPAVVGPFFATQSAAVRLWPPGFRLFVFDAGAWEELGAPMVLPGPSS